MKFHKPNISLEQLKDVYPIAYELFMLTLQTLVTMHWKDKIFSDSGLEETIELVEGLVDEGMVMIVFGGNGKCYLYVWDNKLNNYRRCGSQIMLD